MRGIGVIAKIAMDGAKTKKIAPITKVENRI